MTSSAILIPARYASKRFPGKPLAKLDGKTMIETVYEKCKQTGYDTYILTDDMRIGRIFGWDVCWIDQDVPYENGTERCAGAIGGDLLNKYTHFVNVQGDMPDVTSEMIDKCFWHLKNYSVTTVCTTLPEEKQQDLNTVKVIRSADKCLWFGRGFAGYGERHLGVYGYKRNPLEFYSTMPVTVEEQIEQLEQLRWLKGGWDMGCLPVEFNGIEINTPEDLRSWQNKYEYGLTERD